MMTWKSSTECELTCNWHESDKCLRQVLSDKTLGPRYLSLGILQGVKTIYSPHQLPPCIDDKGNINRHLPVDKPKHI